MISLKNIPNRLNVDNTILIKALSDRIENRITQRSFMAILLSWSYHKAFIVGGFMPAEKKEKPPHVCRYGKLTLEEKKLVKPELKERIRKDRQEWFDSVSAAEHEDKSNKDWLERMACYYYSRKDYEKSSEIDSRIALYKTNEYSKRR